VASPTFWIFIGLAGIGPPSTWPTLPLSWAWRASCSIAMFPLAVVLGIACLRADPAIHRYALPLTVVGAGFAVWHVLVYLDVIPTAIEPCSQGISCRGGGMTILGGMPLPFLSLAAFVAIGILLLVAKRREAGE